MTIPLYNPLIDSILPDIQHLLIPQDGETDRDWSLHTIASEATNYIRDVVWHFLNIQSNNLDYLNVIRDACKESESCDLFTLNHDTLLESYLTSIGIPFADGFGSLENGVRYWNPDILDKVTNGASVYKLHGSINWFRLRPDRGAISTERIGIPEDWDFWHTHNTAGALQMPVDGRPMFLVGTFNKILSYTDEVYFDLHYLFMRHIRTTDRLIVCGYSFGDKAINSQIARWVFDRPNRKLIICHPRVERVRDGARGAIRNNWERWQDNGNIEVVPKYIQNIIWSDLHSVL